MYAVFVGLHMLMVTCRQQSMSLHMDASVSPAGLLHSQKAFTNLTIAGCGWQAISAVQKHQWQEWCCRRTSMQQTCKGKQDNSHQRSGCKQPQGLHRDTTIVSLLFKNISQYTLQSALSVATAMCHLTVYLTRKQMQMLLGACAVHATG